MEEKKTNYTEAYTQLQEILVEIEEGAISLDELSEKVKQATQLIAICKKKLANTEADVSKILEHLSDPKPE